MTQPLRFIPITGLLRYYGSVHPCAPYRYSRPCGLLHLGFSLTIGTTGSHVPHKSLGQGHAIFMPDAAQAIGRFPLN
ncbi:MAG: hypothetical protein ACXU99_14300 [Thermodesulfobacteriota bacterium]